MRSPHTSYRGGERDIEPIKCMLTTHQLQVERRERHRANQVYALHTPATGGEEERHRANSRVCAPTHTATVGGERHRANTMSELHPHPDYMWRGRERERRRDISKTIQVYCGSHTLQLTGGEEREERVIEALSM